jgi:ubiquinone/menaquinone biosynthesis C-methylase UbiE
MMRVTEVGQNLLICHTNDSDLVEPYLNGIRGTTWEGIRIFDVGGLKNELDRGLVIIPGRSLKRYLDRFYLCTSEHDPQSRKQLVEDFFDLIAEDYELLIDKSRNLENIRNLLRFLDELIGPLKGLTVVDYGCATGLSMGPASEFNVSPLGVDSCARMRKIASGRGMSVGTFKHLSSLHHTMISGGFASYVLHLSPDERELGSLWRLLKPKGALVANFHKGKGIDFVNDVLESLGCTVRHLESQDDQSRHGEYVAYIKSR